MQPAGEIFTGLLIYDTFTVYFRTLLMFFLVLFTIFTRMVLVLGGLMIMVGLAFKLSAVPFHFWCPDVFEGASAEVNAFLSVASKAAALALLVRVAIGFGYLPTPLASTEQVALYNVA